MENLVPAFTYPRRYTYGRACQKFNFAMIYCVLSYVIWEHRLNEYHVLRVTRFRGMRRSLAIYFPLASRAEDVVRRMSLYGSNNSIQSIGKPNGNFKESIIIDTWSKTFRNSSQIQKTLFRFFPNNYGASTIPERNSAARTFPSKNHDGVSR
jgi:hypothetical protein